MTWYPWPAFLTQLVATVLVLRVAFITATRRSVPGHQSFTWLAVSIAWWTFTSALGSVIGDALPARIALAQAQYVGIAAVAPFWLLFAREYAREDRHDTRVLRTAIWVLPVATIVLAFTNESHHLLWSAIVPSGGSVVFAHGPWFWIIAGYSYVLLGIGSVVLFRSQRHLPSEYQGQRIVLMFGLAGGWVGNLLYLIGVHPSPGFDLTAVGFAVSGLCLTWGLHRYQLLNLVPIARDQVLDSMQEAVMVVDPAMRVIDINAAAMRLTGARQDWFGQPISTLLPWWDREVDDPTDAPRSTLVSPEDNDKHLEVDITPIEDRRHGIAGWLVLLHDVTARVAGERERLVLDRRLLEQQKLQSLRVVAAGIAHDFNNLLASIIGNADLVAMHLPADADLRQRMDVIVSGAQRAADLVEQMLAYAGEGRGFSKPVDLELLTRETVQLVEGSIARGVPIQYHGRPGVPLVSGDPIQIGQAVLNLLVNAVEAVQGDDKGGPITVRVGQGELTRRYLTGVAFGSDAREGHYVFVEIKDEGPGIDPATLAHIFDPFFTTKHTGHGLGLAAVQGIIRGHGGALHVQSTPGGGSAFRVWLPVSRLGEAEATADAELSAMLDAEEPADPAT